MFEGTLGILYGLLFITALAIAIAVFVFSAFLGRRYRKCESLFDDVVNISGQGTVIFEKNGNLIIANKMTELFIPVRGEKANAVRTLSEFMAYIYDHSVEFDQSFKRVLEKSAGILRSDGFREIISWGEDSLCLVDVRKTEEQRTVITLMDITDYQKQEEDLIKLNDSNHELSSAIEVATNGIIIIDATDKTYPIVFANYAFCEYVSFPREKLISESFNVFLSNLLISDSKSKSVIRNALENFSSIDIEIVLDMSGAETEEALPSKWFNLKLTTVQDRLGAPSQFIGILTDTSELKYNEAEIFQSQKLEALGKLAAGVAHDFNNILSIVDGYARLVVKESEPESKSHGYGERIRTAAQRGAQLTRQMLTFARQKIVVNSVIDLAEVVTEQKTLLLPLLDASINFIIHADSDEFYVECSPDAISQILMNFVVNARDSLEGEGGSILVDIKRCESKDLPKALLDLKAEENLLGYAVLHVTDTGKGMSEALQKKIFDPFFSTKDQGKGTGLGLSMVYGLVKEIGGYIDVRSTLGQGTTFSVYFPLTDEVPTKKALDKVLDMETLCLEGYTALVAEDEPDLRLLVSEMLEKLGMTVISAEDGNDALMKQDDYEGEIDILISDVVMPGMNGVKLSELFLSMRPEAKVIFMSGYPANGQLGNLELPKGSYFMPKPVQYEEMAKLVYERLSEKSDKMSQAINAVKADHWKNTQDSSEQMTTDESQS